MSSRERSTSGRLPLRKLGIVLLVLTLAVGAGCTSVLDDGGSSSGDANLVENVPENQNVLIEVNMSLLSDDTTQRLLQEGEDQSDGAPSESEMEAAFSYVEAETGLDPRDVDRVMIFSQTDDVQNVDDPTEAADEQDERVGILASTSWSQEDVTAAFQNASESALTEVDYAAQDGVLYRVEENESDDDPSYLGVLGDGTFVLGDERSVRASLDTEYDGAASLSGDLLDAYENSRDGYVTAAVLVPEEDRSASQMGTARAMTGVYYTNGSDVGVETRLVMDSADNAEQIAQALEFRLQGMEDSAEYGDLVQNLEIDNDGSDVTVTYESDVDTLLENADSA